ncbi:hypothetical protein ADUPG1_013686, partial [Aduncisulcus paluster]
MVEIHRYVWLHIVSVCDALSGGFFDEDHHALSDDEIQDVYSFVKNPQIRGFFDEDHHALSDDEIQDVYSFVKNPQIRTLHIVIDKKAGKNDISLYLMDIPTLRDEVESISIIKKDITIRLPKDLISLISKSEEDEKVKYSKSSAFTSSDMFPTDFPALFKRISKSFAKQMQVFNTGGQSMLSSFHSILKSFMGVSGELRVVKEDMKNLEKNIQQLEKIDLPQIHIDIPPDLLEYFQAVKAAMELMEREEGREKEISRKIRDKKRELTNLITSIRSDLKKSMTDAIPDDHPSISSNETVIALQNDIRKLEDDRKILFESVHIPAFEVDHFNTVSLMSSSTITKCKNLLGSLTVYNTSSSQKQQSSPVLDSLRYTAVAEDLHIDGVLADTDDQSIPRPLFDFKDPPSPSVVGSNPSMTTISDFVPSLLPGLATSSYMLLTHTHTTLSSAIRSVNALCTAVQQVGKIAEWYKALWEATGDDRMWWYGKRIWGESKETKID